MTITPEQIKAARQLLKWSRVNLAIRAGVGLAVIHKVEAGQRGTYDHAILKLQTVFEAAGVIFVEESGKGSGVRLRNQAPER